MNKDIPAVVAIVPVSAVGWLNLNKVAREHLGLKGSKMLYIGMHDEVTLTTQGNNLEQITLTTRNRIQLPEKALRKLEIDDSSLVALVERKGALAVKTFVIEEKKADKARIVDHEASYKITRIAETNPMPNDLLLKLKEQYKGFKLKFDVKSFLRNRQTFEAWKARQSLGVSEPSDNELRLELIQERLKSQREDGSWGDEESRDAATLAVLTALRVVSLV